MKTQIIFEDEDILVCYKPAGIAVQTAGVFQQDMVSELKNYLAEKLAATAKPSKGKEPYIGVVHRLDQPVSGVLVFAKTQAATASLSAQVQDGRAEKMYRALVYGAFSEKEGVLEDILLKDGKTNTSRVVKEGSGEAKQGKKAKLSYRVLQEISVEEEIYSEAEIALFTGRHHQIRVQMSNAGHPILGDTKYGTPASAELAGKVGKGLKLCACQLTFIHPKTGKKVSFTAPEIF
ncbi:MAG: RluA family pseudouridine synthase [Lachnospiraceae bacterium]|nr:RluA family pseudouridine synthase [Lachnospiraceae bacterium]